MITGLIASLTGDPEGCPKYRADTQTLRSRGYVYVFEVELFTTPNAEGGLDITYSISEPSFNASYPPCQAPFAHDVDIDITDNCGHYAHASDTITLSGWTDTWEWMDTFLLEILTGIKAIALKLVFGVRSPDLRLVILGPILLIVSPVNRSPLLNPFLSQSRNESERYEGRS